MKTKVMIPYEISHAISFLRFPLAVLVVYIHSLGNGDLTTLAHDGLNVNLRDLLGVMISQGVANIAVPLFFLISGYLFFSDSIFTKDDYKNKLKSRCFSLLIPYLLWNFVPLLFVFSKRLIGGCISGDFFSLYAYIRNVDWLHVFWNSESMKSAIVGINGERMPLSGPINYPLWYLRDLIILVILSPLFYSILKSKIKHIFIIVLSMLFIFGVWPNVSILAITGVYFFSLGAYCRVNGYNFLKYIDRYRIYIGITFMFSYGVTIYYNGGALNNMFVLSGIALLLLLGKKAANNKLGEKFIMKRCFFADLSYFIYLSHAVLISTINVHQLVISKILNLFPYCDILDALDYVLYPLLIVALCSLLMLGLKKLCPSILSLIIGNYRI